MYGNGGQGDLLYIFVTHYSCKISIIVLHVLKTSKSSIVIYAVFPSIFGVLMLKPDGVNTVYSETALYKSAANI